MTEYDRLWAKVLKAADAHNIAPWHAKLAALKRYSRACKAAAAARPVRKPNNETSD